MPYSGFYLMASPKKEVATRTVKSLMDCLSLTGGLSSVIGLLAKILLAKLQKQLFFESLINKIFKVVRPT